MSRRRFIARTLLCLALGVVTTVAIAWVLATGILDLDVPGRSAYRKGTNGASSMFLVYKDARGGLFIRAGSGNVGSEIMVGASRFTDRIDDISPHWSRPHLVPGGWNAPRRAADPAYLVRLVIARGWPFRSMMSVLELVSPPATYKSIHGLAAAGSWRGFSGGTYIGAPFTLPTVPLWPAFAADTAIFGASWFLALFAVGGVRQALRRRLRRGLCPACAYDLRATGGPASGCSECGWNRPATATAESPEAPA